MIWTPTKPVQFSLRSLFVLLAIVALLLALPAAQEQREHQRRAEAQRELQELQREIQNQLRPVVQQILAELLKGTNVEVVLPLETAVVWSKPGHDVTSAVIERMNRAAGS